MATTDRSQGPLSGRVAVVTGGSRGLGRQICEGFAAAGADVVVASRKGDACVEVARDLAERHGSDSLAVAANVSDWAHCDRLAELALDHFGGVDILVNNAGLSPLYPSLDQVSEALFDKVLAVNLRGPFRLTARLGASMAERGHGSVINISSVEALRPDAHALPYAAAKAGLEAITLGFARDLAPSVRVNAIRCGMFDTDIAASWGNPTDVEAMAAKTIPLGRVGQPSEVVGTALHLASDASSYCTGAVITLDGGIGL